MITVSAPAKVNLFLHVTGRRKDGYHLLESLAAFCHDIADEITIEPHPVYKLNVTGDFAHTLTASTAENIVTKAVKTLCDATGRPMQMQVTLTKNLPVAAGIGGGSSDAAAVLRALSNLWDLGKDQLFLYVAAQKLGADVPVCLGARPAFMGGIGETISLLESCAACPIVLINPRVPVLTADVFKRFRDAFSNPVMRPQELESVDALVRYIAPYRNDLTDGATELAPPIRTVLSALGATKDPQLVRLSGSGATCFALYKTAQAAQTAAVSLQDDHPDWWVRAGTLQGYP